METNFIPESTYEQMNIGHGRIEKRKVSICQTLDGIRPMPGLTTLIRVKLNNHIGAIWYFIHHYNSCCSV